jgi:hypothetical protein
MKMLLMLLAMLISVLVIAQNPVASSNEFASVAQILGQPGKTQPDKTQKYSWPRRDLAVTANGVSIEPGLAFGSWAAFKSISKTEAITMGDLVLLPAEVNPVIRKLQSGGLNVLAVHNHLFGETPEVVYVHFMGHGQAELLARALREGLNTTKTPLETITPATTPPKTQKAFDTIQKVLGRKGNISGKVLQVAAARKEAITEDGMEIPASMEMAISMNFQVASENRIASTGDFVLITDEVTR